METYLRTIYGELTELVATNYFTNAQRCALALHGLDVALHPHDNVVVRITPKMLVGLGDIGNPVRVIAICVASEQLWHLTERGIDLGLHAPTDSIWYTPGALVELLTKRSYTCT